MHYFAEKRFPLSSSFSGFNRFGLFDPKVYINKPRIVLGLKNNIRNEIEAITPEILRNVMEDVLESSRLCEAQNDRLSLRMIL